MAKGTVSGEQSLSELLAATVNKQVSSATPPTEVGRDVLQYLVFCHGREPKHTETKSISVTFSDN